MDAPNCQQREMGVRSLIYDGRHVSLFTLNHKEP